MENTDKIDQGQSGTGGKAFLSYRPFHRFYLFTRIPIRGSNKWIGTTDDLN
jgi:hypothetical protein